MESNQLSILSSNVSAGLRKFRYRFGYTIPEELPEEHQEIILNGTDELFHFHYENDFGGVRDVETTFEGVLKNIERRYHDTNSDFTREQMRFI